jgi:hypothetical protein
VVRRLLAAAFVLAVAVVGMPDARGATTVDRLAGDTRYETAIAVAAALHPGGATTALVASGTSYPDALASGPLAARLAGVALLVDGSGRAADDASLEFLADHADAVADVAILGGRAAVTSTADRAIQEALGLA